MDPEILALPFILAARWLCERTPGEWSLFAFVLSLGGLLGWRLRGRAAPPKQVATIVTPGGPTVKDQLFEFLCWHCGCKFRFLGRDSGTFWHVGTVLFMHNDCPDCGMQINIHDDGCGRVE